MTDRLARPLALALLFSLALASCAGGRNRTGADVTVGPEKGLPMPVIKAADAANVCYIEPTEELRARLSPEAFAVLVQNATEPPFRNAYWDNHAEGVYLDAIDGTPLFASSAKFDSGTGWPSFWQPLDPATLVLVEDISHGMRRVEVRAKASGGHLGHVFTDGPEPTGLRYCINSASLRFVPRDRLKAEGLGDLEGMVWGK